MTFLRLWKRDQLTQKKLDQEEKKKKGCESKEKSIAEHYQINRVLDFTFVKFILNKIDFIKINFEMKWFISVFGSIFTSSRINFGHLELILSIFDNVWLLAPRINSCL